MNAFLFILYLLTGLISGLFLGMVGIGAALFTIPILIMTGLTINEATIVALIIQLLPQTIPGIIMYYNQKMIKLDIVYISLLILIGSFFGVYLGTTLTLKNYISKRFLYRFLVITLLFSAFYISYKYWNIPS
jgi:uncharacterized membrane protein YfcA